MIIEFENNALCQVLYGVREENLRILEENFHIHTKATGNILELTGDEENLVKANHILQELYKTVEKGFPLYPDDIRRAIQEGGTTVSEESPDEKVELHQIFTDTILVTPRNKSITPKGQRQKKYVDFIRRNDLVFGIGPAGTGKTYLAMAMAVAALKSKAVERIILTRPAVEAGEKLGFLPGTLQDKVNPYLRPLYDALREMVSHDTAEEWLQKEMVEVAPLAFMRGRTLNHAFVILDEAQNTSREQMKMFLTRLGNDSKAVVTGDITQVDLPKKYQSGLLQVERILQSVKGIAFSYFQQEDVVRHNLVQRIIEAYEKDNKRKERERAEREEKQEST